MKIRLALLVIFVLSVAPIVPSAAAGADRFALVIGNAKYPDADAPLKEPINDARDIAEELKRDGFNVEIGENLTGDAMRRAFERLCGGIKPDSVALLFFSGCGVQSSRQSYMIPVDAKIWTEADVRRDGISLETVLGEINSRGAGVKIALIDASMRNPFERRFRSFSAGLAPVIAPNGTLVMYSAALSSVISDNGRDRSLFVQELLGPAKEVAQIGAAIGREFSHALLASVARQTAAELELAVDRLIEAGLLFRQGVPPHANYLFKHALVQDVAYGTLLRVKRHDLHASIASVLERQFSDVCEIQPEVLARHYAQAGLAEQAINYWQRAGDRAAKRSANQEAVAHFRNAIELLETLPDRAARAEQELQLLIALGPALMTTRSSAAPEIGHVYARARELAHNAQRVADLFPTVWGAWLVAFTAGDLATAGRLVDELLGMANTSGDSALMLQAHHAAWPNFMATGALAMARHHVARGLALYRRDAHGEQALQYGGHDPGVCGYVIDALIAAVMGYPDHAVRQMQEGLRLARDLDHGPSLAQALWFVAELHQIRREPQKVEESVSVVLPLLARHGSAVGVANANMLRGWACLMQGRLEEGLAVTREGLAAWRATGSKFHVPYRLVRAAEAHLIAGEIEDGLRLIGEATDRSSDCWFSPELYRLRGELLLEAGGRGEVGGGWG